MGKSTSLINSAIACLTISCILSVSGGALNSLNPYNLRPASAGSFLSIDQDSSKRAKLTVVDTMINSFPVVSITDTARNEKEISNVIGRCYGKLFAFTGSHHLKPGRMMASYLPVQGSFYTDVSIEIDKAGVQGEGRIRSEMIQGGNALVVHFKGPYEQTYLAYSAITEWLSAHHKTADRQPIEIYLNSPAFVKDPYELKTDIYQFIK